MESPTFVHLKMYSGAETTFSFAPNGERSNKEKDPYKANNFTFGSAKYVAAITKQVKAAFKTHTRVYIGGHSQGGYACYSCIMHYPELYDGAFPMAGGCWKQNAPNLFETEPEKMALQQQMPIAVIHGRSDKVVDYELGKRARQVFPFTADIPSSGSSTHIAWGINSCSALYPMR